MVDTPNLLFFERNTPKLLEYYNVSIVLRNYQYDINSLIFYVDYGVEVDTMLNCRDYHS